ncbi:putative nonaspanin (TM9SF) [Helianthus annuus]|nr:putative nonaspanin (TM9SF) [Helianthus annuus]
MQEELPCQVVCRIVLDAKSAKSFKDMIDDEYRVNMILDNLPVAVLRRRLYGSQSTVYQHGFRVGFKGRYAGNEDELYFLNNHLSFRVIYHKNPDNNSARIVGFEVTPHRFILSSLLFMEENQDLVTRVDLGYVLSNGSNM